MIPKKKICMVHPTANSSSERVIGDLSKLATALSGRH